VEIAERILEDDHPAETKGITQSLKSKPNKVIDNRQ
jgi:hypothetical protein